jgi:tetratricopeptide (TPR) repeat protein
MELINDGSWKEFERKASIFQKIFSQNQEVVLIVLSKMVIAYARQGLFDKAQGELSRFCEIYTNVVDSPFFSALAMYLQIVLKRKQKDFCGIDELLGSALAEAESIEIGCLTAAIHLLVATVTSFKERKSESNQDKLCNTAIEHLDYVLEPDSVTWDMKQKSYITLVLSNLNCVLSKDIILAKECTESDLREAKSAMKAFNEVALESPPNRFRTIQSELAKSVLHYRQAQVKGKAYESRKFVKRALNFAKQAETLAIDAKFDEMKRWSKQLIRACTAQLVWNRLNMPKQEQELGDV